MDLNIYDYKLVFGTDVNLKLDKAQRLIYGDSEMTHAMVITAIHEEVCLKGNIINDVTQRWAICDLIIFPITRRGTRKREPS